MFPRRHSTGIRVTTVLFFSVLGNKHGSTRGVSGSEVKWVTGMSLRGSGVGFLLMRNIRRGTLRDLHTTNCAGVRFRGNTLSSRRLGRSVHSTRFVNLQSHARLARSIVGTTRGLITVNYFYVKAGRISLSTTTGHKVPMFGTPFSGAHSITRLIVNRLLLLLHNIPRTGTGTRHNI